MELPLPGGRGNDQGENVVKAPLNEHRLWRLNDNRLSREDGNLPFGPHDMHGTGKTRVERMDDAHDLYGLIRIVYGSSDKSFLYRPANALGITW